MHEMRQSKGNQHTVIVICRPLTAM